MARLATNLPATALVGLIFTSWTPEKGFINSCFESSYSKLNLGARKEAFSAFFEKDKN